MESPTYSGVLPSAAFATAAVAWAAVAASAVSWWPLVTVDSGVPGPQPRLTVLAAGDPLSLGALVAPLLVAVAVLVLLRASRTGRHRGVTSVIALTLAGVLVLAALVGTVTLFFPVVELPGAALALVAALVARQERPAPGLLSP